MGKYRPNNNNNNRSGLVVIIILLVNDIIIIIRGLVSDGPQQGDPIGLLLFGLPLQPTCQATKSKFKQKYQSQT